LLLAVFFSFVVPIFVIIGLVKFVTSSDTTGAGTANAEMAKAMRLQKVGTVEIRDANRLCAVARKSSSRNARPAMKPA
jgi:hypothetical protein